MQKTLFFLAIAAVYSSIGWAQTECTFPCEFACGEFCCHHDACYPPELAQQCWYLPAIDNFGVVTQSVSDSTTLGYANDMHMNWSRLDLWWRDIEPTPGQYYWPDSLVSAVQNSGLSILGLIYRCPNWASSNGAINGYPKDANAVQRWRDFVRAMVQRYPQIQHWEFWNEPNNSQFFTGPFERYVNAILRPAAEEIHAACPTCKVVGPTLMWSGPSAMSSFYNQLNSYGAASYIDIVSQNFYECFSQTCIHQKMSWFFNMIDSRGFAGKPVWITETGSLGSQQAQAEALISMVQYKFSWPRIANLFAYRLRANDWSGIISESGVQRLAYGYLVDMHTPQCKPWSWPY